MEYIIVMAIVFGLGWWYFARKMLDVSTPVEAAPYKVEVQPVEIVAEGAGIVDIPKPAAKKPRVKKVK